VPKSAAQLGFDAPVHALLTGAPDEFDRRIEVLSAPRYGIVGQSRSIEIAVREAGKTGGSFVLLITSMKVSGTVYWPSVTRTVIVHPGLTTSLPGVKSFQIGLPIWVGMSAVLKISLMPIGTPQSFPA